MDPVVGNRVKATVKGKSVNATILKRMGIHKGVRRVLKSLYSGCIGMLCLCGRIFGNILQESGVKQGDPASMVLFILAYDLILRWISASLSPYRASLFGMCDDLAISTDDLESKIDLLS